MGDKETFANELDRLLQPAFEFLDIWGTELLDYPDVDHADSGKHMPNEDDVPTWSSLLFGGFDYKVDNEHEDYTLSSGGVEVYRRTFSGRTQVLRPGEWVTGFVRKVYEWKLDYEVNEVKDALTRELDKRENFQPV